MMFLKIPFVPTGKVTCMVVDRNAPKQLIDNLQKQNISVIVSAQHPRIMSKIATHPDMQIHPLKENLIVCEPTLIDYYQQLLGPLGFALIPGHTRLENHYPADVAYNVTRMGGVALHNKKVTDPAIVRYFEQAGVRIYHTKQGYTKCTTCVVSQHAAITEDRGVAKALSCAGVDVLTIPPGHVALGGFSHGFIGGCSGLLEPNLLGFCGRIDRHPQFKAIRAFLEKHEVDITSLTDQMLTDIGSMIPIMQV